MQPENHQIYGQLTEYFNRFLRLGNEPLRAVLDICRVIHVPAQQDLQPIGRTCKTIYFINRGIARIYYYKDGVDITDSLVLENELIVRVESLFTGKPGRKGIQVLEDAEIVAIDAEKLFSLYDTFHEVERLFRLVFEAVHVETVTRIENIQFHTARERYNRLIAESPDIVRRVPLKYIASYLGITPVSLSRIRALK